MKLRRVRLFVYFILLVSLVTSLFGCSSTSSPAEDEATPTPYPTAVVPTKPTYEVMRGEVIEEMQFSARVEPVVQEGLFFRAGGRVRDVYVEEGDEVVEGQVLADLEYLDDLERQLAADQLRLRRSEIYVENAQIALALFKINVPVPETLVAEAAQEVANAQEAVRITERDYGFTQSTADQSSIDAAYAQMLLAKESYEKAQERFEPYASKPESNLTRARLQANLSAAESNYNRAVAQYNAMTGTSSESAQELAYAEWVAAQARLAEAEAELERVQEDPVPKGYYEELALKENDLELAQIAYEETKVSVADVESSIADAQMVAPFAGVVTRLIIKKGRSAEAFKDYAEVSDMSQLELSANLTSDEMSELEVGMPVSVNLVSKPGEPLSGVIRYLPYGAAVDDDEELTTTRIALDVSMDEAGVETGDLMRVTVVLEQKDDVLWLPPQAIRTFEGRRFVVVQEDGYQQRVDIKIGIEGEDRTEIEEGVDEGMVVISP